MSNALCYLLLYGGKIKLIYRSFKSLKSFECSSSSSDVQLSRNKSEDGLLDWEVLILWALVGVHEAYSASGAEFILSSLIPFYYLLKMVLLFVILFVPNTGVPTFVLFSFVVPVIHKCHFLLCEKWGQFHEFLKGKDPTAIPLMVLDLFFPGIYTQTCKLDDADFILKHGCEKMNCGEECSPTVTRVAPALRMKALRWKQLQKESSSSLSTPPQLGILNSTSSIMTDEDSEHDSNFFPTNIDKENISSKKQTNFPQDRDENFDDHNGCPFAEPFEDNFGGSIHSSTVTKYKKKSKNRRNRNSIGESVRSFVTGDSDIRLRDYLFDLHLPQNICVSGRSSFDGTRSDVVLRSSPMSADRQAEIKRWCKNRRKSEEPRRISCFADMSENRNTKHLKDDEKKMYQQREVEKQTQVQGDEKTTSSTPKYPTRRSKRLAATKRK